MNPIPRELIRTPRLLLRRWQPDDAPALAEAIAASLAELARWTPWVIPEAPALPTLEARLAEFSRQFEIGENFVYGIFDASGARALGSMGLYRRVGPGALEIGYFIRSDETGRGYATEAAAALTAVALAECGIERLELRVEAGNTASRAIPGRLGYSYVRTLLEEPRTPGGRAVELMVWERLAHGPECELQGEVAAAPVARRSPRPRSSAMVEKPLTSDPEQRAWQTRVAREQSGLPPEEESQPQRQQPKRPRPEQPNTEGSGHTPEP